MATGALDANGVWIYGEDDSETTFSALINKLGSSVSAQLSGRIIQAVSTTKTDSFSITGGVGVITGLSATITPKYTSSKILVILNIGVISSNTANEVSWLYLRRNGIDIGLSTGRTTNSTGVMAYPTANLVSDFAMTYQDSPVTTSALTYSVAIAATGGTTYINRWAVNNDRGGISTITLLEVDA